MHRTFHKFGACRACGNSVRCSVPGCDGAAVHWCVRCGEILTRILREEFPDIDLDHLATCQDHTNTLAARVRQVILDQRQEDKPE